MTGSSASARRLRHQLDAVAAGQDQIEQHQRRQLGVEDAGEVSKVARGHRVEAGPVEGLAGGPCARGAPGVLAEQVRQLLRGDAAALVGDRQLDVAAVERGRHPDRRRRRVPS